VRLLYLIFVLLLATASQAMADGIVLPKVVDPAAVTIPDQQALVSFVDGTETLAIETRFEASGGSDFAWIVPVPAAPEVSAGTTGTFPTLQALFAPEVIQTDWLPGAIVGVVLLAIAGLAMSLPSVLVRVTSVFACLVLTAGVFLPTLGKPRGIASGPAVAGVEVLERKLVGSFDVGVLRSDDSGALAHWLDDNGFAVPSAAKPAMDQYVREGWFFVAAKVHRDGSGVATPHPLVLRFAAKEPVYPMRLTAAAIDHPLRLELYVFGPQRAAAPGMRVERCGPAGPELDKNIVVRHAALADLTQGATFGTKLMGEFTSQQAAEDVRVRWDGTASRVQRFVSDEDRVVIAVLAAAGILAAWVWVLALWRSARPKASRKPARSLLTLAGLAGGVGVAVLVFVPSIATVQASSPVVARLIGTYADLAVYSENCPLWDSSGSSLAPESTPGTRVALVRLLVSEYLKTSSHVGRIDYDDSPGNYIIRQRGDWIELVMHGPRGEENSHQLLWTGEGEAKQYKPLFE
jgi:hypothetical protein